jgi:hypothetical protein
VQPMEDMLQSPARAPAQAENQHAAMAGPNPGGSVAGGDQARFPQRNSVRVW